MTDHEKVMSWLEGLTDDDWRRYHSDSEVRNIAKAALELLKEQEARVLTLDEMLSFDGAMLTEYNPDQLSMEPEWIMFHWMNEKIVHFWLNGKDQYYMASSYGKSWRCWSARPTNEQRESVKWE